MASILKIICASYTFLYFKFNVIFLVTEQLLERAKSFCSASFFQRIEESR